jgi:predicted DNA-binding transcriptional regulator AlpA
MPEQLLAAFAVAAVLGLKPRTIDNWRFLPDKDDPRRKLLPPIRVGSRIRYRQSDVDNYIRVMAGITTDEKAHTPAPRKPTDKPARKAKPRRSPR